ncbi:CDP-2,3-bis-(O-geranylgeranyl)-sn-glycerol synthase [Candidatus Aenigmatarchaeota archaeon]
MIIETIIAALWFVIPAYASNSFPVLVKGKKPIDFGKNFRGRRLLGDGKTIEGSIAGIIFGLFLGSIQVFYQHLIPMDWGLPLIEMTFPIVVLMVIGTILGDYVGSFIKRRIGIGRGGKATGLDQLDFIVVSLLLVSIVFVPDLVTITIVIVATLIIHKLSNILGYILKLKKTPY